MLSEKLFRHVAVTETQRLNCCAVLHQDLSLSCEIKDLDLVR